MGKALKLSVLCHFNFLPQRISMSQTDTHYPLVLNKRKNNNTFLRRGLCKQVIGTKVYTDERKYVFRILFLISFDAVTV